MNIVVLTGGISTERNVSLSTGTLVCKALRKKGHKAVLLDVFWGCRLPVDLETVFETEESLLPENAAFLADSLDLEKMYQQRGGDSSSFFGENVLAICKKADIVYLGLHGADGENGKVQAAFDVLGIRYTGSGYLGSALAMDKGIAKQIFQASDIPTPKGYRITRETAGQEEAKISYPCIIKPCCGGSSVGVSIAKNSEEYRQALETGFQYEEELLAEEYICGREFSVGVLDGKSLPVIEIIPKEGFYDYETKYQPGMATDVCPAELSRELTEAMQAYAIRVYQELRLETYGRIDFLLDAQNRMYCLEANTLPGMTPTSLLPQEAAAVGMDYETLCEQIVGISLQKYSKKKRNNSVGKYTLADKIPVYTSCMRGITPEEIAKACHAVYYGPDEARNREISMITTDSRQIETGCLFVALKGARVDGSCFVNQAYADGALCCLSERKPEGLERPYLVVESAYLALQDIAKLYRSRIPAKVIGITGSVGKTTTKEMLASVLAEHFCVLKTQGNYNNEVGVPLTLFRLRREHEIAIVEMGISDFGEMTRLSAMAQPDFCVITNIGQCHLENLQDRDGVLRAKTEIFTGMNPQGSIYLNGDDDKLAGIRHKRQNITFFGVENKEGVYAKDIENIGLRGSRVTVCAGQKEFTITVPAPGRHMVLNALAAVAIALDLGMTEEEIRTGIAKFQPVGGHASLLETRHFTILDDCYNANPASMRAGLSVLENALHRRVAILGDMYELGDEEEKLHYQVGAFAAHVTGLLLCIGSLSRKMYEGAQEVIRTEHLGQTAAYYFETQEEAVAALPDLLEDTDTILVKASHGMHFEKIVAVLKEM